MAKIKPNGICEICRTHKAIAWYNKKRVCRVCWAKIKNKNLLDILSPK